MNHSKPLIDWETVYWEQMPRIYNFFRYRVGDDTLAEDLTAATFEKAWQHRDKYDHDIACFATWLYSIARNVAKNHYRQRKQRKITVPLSAVLHLIGHSSPEETAQHNDDLAQLNQIIGGLEDRERELISLKYGAELSNRAIAQITGLSESNVGTILHRALQRVRAQWETVA